MGEEDGALEMTGTPGYAEDGYGDEPEEVALIRRTRAAVVTEYARQRGDTADALIAGLLGDNEEELSAEREERRKRAEEAVARERERVDDAESRKMLEKQAAIEDEARRQEEKEARRLKLISDMEKQRKREAGEVDEEEEAAKRAAAEAEAKRIADEKAREAAEDAALAQANRELAAQISELKKRMADEDARDASGTRKQRAAFIIIAAVVLMAIGAGVAWYFLNKKAPDFYRLSAEYPVGTIEMIGDSPVGFSDLALASRIVTQEAPQVVVKAKKTKKDDIYGVTDVFASGTIVK